MSPDLSTLVLYPDRREAPPPTLEIGGTEQVKVLTAFQ
jgi:hypothetical protein